jgi:hypothetical protein
MKVNGPRSVTRIPRDAPVLKMVDAFPVVRSFITCWELETGRVRDKVGAGDPACDAGSFTTGCKG